MNDTTFVNGHYLSRSWRMMTQDKGWIKPVLLLALCLLVPIAGPIAAAGYLWSWARLTAWGVDSAPKQRGVDVGGCFAAGWRVVVVTFVWMVVAGFAQGVLGSLFYGIGTTLGNVMSVVLAVAMVFVGLLGTVACLRATVYEKIVAGFGLPQVWDMATRDFGGLLRVLGIVVLGGVAECLLSLVAGLAILATMLPAVLAAVAASVNGYVDSALAYELLDNLSSGLAGVFPLAVLFGYGISLVSVVFSMLAVNALGLWARQFDVPAWGGPGEPVPPSVRDQGTRVTSPQPPASPAPWPGYPMASVSPDNGAPFGVATPVDSGYQPPTDHNEEATAMDTIDKNAAENVVPPAPEDLYEKAADNVTSWTSVVEPERDATDHMAYEPKATEAPAPANDNGVTPPSPADIYGAAAGTVAAGAEVGLADSAAAASSELAGEDLSRSDVPQSPVTAPAPEDLYEKAADNVTSWTSVVEPERDATDHMAYEPKATEAPAPANDNGVTPPSPADIYGAAAHKVAQSPEISLDDSATAAENELIADDVAFSDPEGTPVVDAADGAPVPPYMAPAEASGSEPEPIVTPLTKRDDEE